MLMRLLAQASPSQPIDPSKVQWSTTAPSAPSHLFSDGLLLAFAWAILLLVVGTLLYLIRRGNLIRWVAFGIASALALACMANGERGSMVGLVAFLTIMGLGFAVDRATTPPVASRAPGFPVERRGGE